MAVALTYEKGNMKRNLKKSRAAPSHPGKPETDGGSTAALRRFSQLLAALCRPAYRDGEGNWHYEYADRPKPPRTVALWRLKEALAAVATVTRRDGERVEYGNSRAAIWELIRAVESGGDLR